MQILLSYVREAFARAAFAATGARCAPEAISAERQDRCWTQFVRDHKRRGGAVLTTERNGLVAVTLEV
ncbi:MAG TPA: hypothetical protein VJP88_05855 [Caulobacteraceae bacterium]|nr:hypothetical protein [Caulobacteraceae bacterium]